MQLFVRRYWGFTPETWPLISFGLEGNRDALSRDARPGDRVVIVGTFTEETAPAERGRLLGMAEIGRKAVDTADVLDLSKLGPEHFDTDGQIKWPKSLPMVRAWRFPDRPLLTDVLRKQLPYGPTVRAVLLDEADTKAVLQLRHVEVDVPSSTAIQQQRNLNAALQLTRGGATTGPRPTSWQGETGRDASEAAFTYAFRFGKRDIWKIGHAKDLIARLNEVRKHVPHEILRETWEFAYQHSWANQALAYEMEQRVLAALRDETSVGERVSCSERQLRTTWQASLTG